MRILGIETTCDETGAAVVEGDVRSGIGLRVLSNVVASSVDLQKRFGGVVPEVAAREQVRSILPVIAEAIGYAAKISSSKHQIPNNLSNPEILKWAKENIDAIAVAHGPGLVGPLLIGVETAKALALVWNKPLIAVNHLVGHIYANWLESNPKFVFRLETRSRRAILNSKLPLFPLVALIVSGGHTDLVLVTDHGKYKLLGSTLDDASGEAFDKVAKLLGLGYPGGPEIERLAAQASNSKHQISNIKLPRPMINSKDFDFSFSGLKTAVVSVVNKLNYSSSERSESRSLKSSSRQARTINNDFKSQVAYEFQQAVVDVLVRKTIGAAQKFGAKSIVVGGGVAANSELRSWMSDIGQKENMNVYFPSSDLSVDNGAMIATAAFYNFDKVDPLKLSADPSLHF